MINYLKMKINILLMPVQSRSFNFEADTLGVDISDSVLKEVHLDLTA